MDHLRVEPFAFFAQQFDAGLLPDVLGLDAAAGLTIVVVVVGVRVGRVPRTLALEGTGVLPQTIRGRVQEPFSWSAAMRSPSGRHHWLLGK